MSAAPPPRAPAASERTRAFREAEERILRDFPFHAAVVAGWRAYPAPVDTMGVMVRGGVVELAFNQSFVEGLAPEHLVGVMLHEIHHVIFGHVHVDARRLGHPHLYLLACELTANELIPRELLPDEATLLEHFPALPAGEDTATRYERLVRARRRPGEPPGLRGHSAGWGGSDPGAGRQDLPDLARLLRDFPVLARGRGGGAGSARLRALRARIRRDLSPVSEDESVSAAGGAGLDWEAIIRRHVTAAGETELSFRRPSRRFPELVGVVPGAVRRRPRVMAVLDTSGSMEAGVLALVNRELPALARTCDVTVVECDDHVRFVRRYVGPLGEVQGRGNTDLRPPFEREVMVKVRPDAVVYFTDGGGEAPDRPPAGVPVIWCLSPGGEAPASWGVTLRLDR